MNEDMKNQPTNKQTQMNGTRKIGENYMKIQQTIIQKERAKKKN